MKNILYHTVRIALGFIFLFAAYHKILRPDEFAQSIENYHLLNPTLVHLAAITFPYIEAIFGILLVSGITVPAAALGVTCLMLVFIIALISALLRGIDAGCGCFSSEGEAISLMGTVRDVGFLCMGIFVLVFSIKREIKTKTIGRRV